MRSTIDIPTEPLVVNHTSTGFLPDIAIHERDGVLHHESSHSHFVFASLMATLAIIAVLWPTPTPKSFGMDLRYFIAGIFLWGGFCGLIPYFIRNRFGQYITFDTIEKMITLQSGSSRKSIANRVLDPIAESFVLQPHQEPIRIQFADVVAIQLAGAGPYQANLVYRENGELRRHNLYQHASYQRILKLAERYSKIGPFDLVSSS